MLLKLLSSVAARAAGSFVTKRKPMTAGGCTQYGWVGWVGVLAVTLSPQTSAADFQVARFQLAEDAQVTAVPVQTNVSLKVVVGVPQPSASWTHVEPANADFGDGPPKIPEIYTKTQWQVEQGLPSDRVHTILQTSDGYLWLGTSGGLVRFDGRRFRVFDSSNTPAMQEARNDVRHVIEDSAGTLWLATSHALLRRRGLILERIPGSDRPLIGTIQHLAPRKAGGIWVGTDQGAWSYVDGDRFRPLGEHHHVFMLGETSADGLVVSMPNWTVRIHPETPDRIEEIYSNTPASTNEAVRFGGAGKLYIDAAQDIYLGSQRAVLRLGYGAKNWIRQAGPFGPSADADPPNDLAHFTLVGTTIAVASGPERELSLWREGSPVRFATDTGDRIVDVTCLTADRDGSLWVGIDHAGLVRLRRQPLATLSLLEPGAHERTLSVTEGSDGSIWCGTRGGVIQWGTEGARVFEFGVASTLEGVNALWRVPSGMVWAAFGDDGMVQMASGFGMVLMANQTKHYYPGERSTLGSGTPRALYSTRNRLFWLGTKQGLIRGHERFSTRQGLPHPDVRAFFEDASGQLWIGTYGGGICRMRDQLAAPGTPDLFEVFDQRHGLNQDRVWGFHEDRDGAMWLATEDGLVRFRKGQFFVFTSKHGLFEEPLNQILEDDNGRLWLGTNRGIHRVNRDDLNLVADGAATWVPMVSYGTSDGMLKSETNGESSPSGCKASDGRLYFPTQNGVVVVDPSSVVNAPVPPAPVMEEIIAEGERVFLEGVAVTNHVNIPADTGVAFEFRPGHARSVDFHFSATSVTDPDGVRLEYRLEGFDPAWRPGRDDRVASYTNLKPGRYRFLVRALAMGITQKPAETSLSFRVAPHFWQTIPFYVLCGIGVAGVGAALVAYRLRLQRRIHTLEQRNALDQERSRIARDMHDQLGAKLSKMALGSDRSPGAQQEVRETLRELRELIWSVNPKNDTLAGLAEFLAKAAQHYLGAAGLAMDLEFPSPVPEARLTSATRHQIAGAFQEALRNIVQHAQATEVRISLRVGASLMRLEIVDDGKGFDLDPPPAHGTGLSNLRHRMTEIRGECFLSSTPGKGTRVEFLIPLQRP
jgi:ligand-binding sensor domain-containing protein